MSATDISLREAYLAAPTVGVVADAVTLRRIEGLLSFPLVASGPGVDSLLDHLLDPLDVAVLVGGPELLARGGVVELLHKLRPHTQMVLVSETDDRAAVCKALRAGVSGFISRRAVDRLLAPAIDAVLAGQLVVPQSIQNRIQWGSFSVREKQVLQLVADGLTNYEIAARLFLSESTVKSHLSSSFRKLGVSSRAEAAAVVMDPDHGLRTPEPAGPLADLERQLLSSPPV